MRVRAISFYVIFGQQRKKTTRKKRKRKKNKNLSLTKYALPLYSTMWYKFCVASGYKISEQRKMRSKGRSCDFLSAVV